MDMPPPAAAAAAVASTRKAEVEAAASPPKAPSSAERQISDGSSDGAALPPISAQQRPRISAERKHLWSGLLAKRPPTKDGEAVSGWLMEVLSVSDLDTPLKENGTAAETSVASGALAGLAAVAKGQGQQSVLKNKKRPLALLQKEDGKGEKKGNLGSFSDWKDRKKNKLPKKGTPSKDD